MATVYLHIGLPKTGTTSLRRFFWEKENRAAFEKHGICFPDFGLRYTRKDLQEVDMRRNGHFLVAPFYDENNKPYFKIPSQDYEVTLDKIAELGKRFDKILLTDEGIWSGSTNRQDFWEKLKADLDKRGLDIKIIIYFRRQDLWMESYYAQNLKDGDSHETLHDFLKTMKRKNYPVDYYAYVSKLAEIYGKDALILRIFEFSQFVGPEKSIYSDFLDIFGLTLADGFELKHGVYNTKFEGNYLELRRMLNYLPEYRTRSHLLIRSIEAIQSKNFFGHNYKEYTYFEPQERREYMESFAESNSKLAREYFGRNDGILFHDPVEEKPEFEIDNGELIRDTVLVFAKMINMLVQQNEKQAEDITTILSYLDKMNGDGKLPEELANIQKPDFSQTFYGDANSLREMALFYSETISSLTKENLSQSKKIEALAKENLKLSGLVKESKGKMDLLRKEMMTKIGELREDVLLYRLKRKTKNLFGKK